MLIPIKPIPRSKDRGLVVSRRSVILTAIFAVAACTHLVHAENRNPGDSGTQNQKPVTTVSANVGPKSNADQNADQNVDWTSWRGPGADGNAGLTDGESGKFPMSWGAEQSPGSVKSLAKIPGSGGSTPVCRDGVLYVTAGTKSEKNSSGQNTLMAIDANEGNLLWKTSLGNDAGNKHRKGGGSNPSVALGTDDSGKTIAVAYFRSGDLAAVNADGKVLWQWNLQDRYDADTLWWDLGSSPVVADDSIVLAVIQTGPSYLLRVDLKTGELIWKSDRDVPAPKEAAQTYSTPVIANIGGRQVIATLGADHLTLHDFDDGEMLAALGGFNPSGDEFFRSIASPVISGTTLVFPYARGETVTGIDLTKLLAGQQQASILWNVDWIGSDVPTPAIAGETVYLIDDSNNNKGTVAALSLVDGQTQWTVELPKSRNGYSSSPLVAGNHLYIVREDAVTFVVGPLDQPEPKLVAENPLPDDSLYTVASPIAVDGDLVIRTHGELFRISE